MCMVLTRASSASGLTAGGTSVPTWAKSLLEPKALRILQGDSTTEPHPQLLTERLRTVHIHMSKGFIFLALALCLVLLPAMFLSFRPVCRRLNKIDFVFSFLSISIGLLILLSLTLFVINCNRLRPRPQVSYQLAFYLCWCASVLMLWAGTLSFLNQVRVWTYTTPLMERRVSYFRWASRRVLQLQPISDQRLESTQSQSAASSLVNHLEAPPGGDSATSQDTEEFSQPDASTSVPVTPSPSDLP
ncbi:uncharacterized protein LOC121136207 isoform X2 [Mesocricetus auratus]|uniref:Uncharacterized protein LOC121136207 isoform X2 n=1 Tax=Mesocricetus auratus TaxID=10036 RepID=A0ABM2WMQ7_MESAU|nr:uncharacterized protein LOC121136207 isoform X2 [Mesocricetus auratus]